jgi:hypothetical protein
MIERKENLGQKRNVHPHDKIVCLGKKIFSSVIEKMTHVHTKKCSQVIKIS